MLHPIFVLVGYVLAFFYGLIPNYAVAIALLTIAVMIVVFPLTRASARSMMRMQLLAPEMKKIQTRYKAKPGTPAAERQELRQKMNEEVMALYRENGVNPTGGCLPMFLQFPILIVLYDVVRGLSKTADVLNARPASDLSSTASCWSWRRRRTSRRRAGCTTTSSLAKGQMHALGINLADSVRTHQPSSGRRHPLRVAGARSPSACSTCRSGRSRRATPPRRRRTSRCSQMQKYMPLIFLVLYIALPAGVGVYFIVSSLFRVGQQEWMYKHDPTIVGGDPGTHQAQAGGSADRRAGEAPAPAAT